MRISSNSAKFSAGRPLLPGYNFSATISTIYSTYCLGPVASLKFLAIENMTPHFGPCLLWHNVWMDQEYHLVRRYASTQATLCEMQACVCKPRPLSIVAKWLDGSGYQSRIPLGTEVDLSPGDIVLDGDPALLTERGTATPTFWPTLPWHGRPSQQLLSSC